MARCPRKVFSYNSLKKTVDIEDAGACILCGECSKYLNVDLDPANHPEYSHYNIDREGWDRMVRIDENMNKYIFTVESTGALSPEDIVLKAFSVLRTKLQILKEAM